MHRQEFGHVCGHVKITQVEAIVIRQPGLDLESWVTVLPIEAAAEVLAGGRRPTKPIFRP